MPAQSSLTFLVWCGSLGTLPILMKEREEREGGGAADSQREGQPIIHPPITIKVFFNFNFLLHFRPTFIYQKQSPLCGVQRSWICYLKNFCCESTHFYKEQHILRTKAFLFSLSSKIRSKKDFFVVK